MGKILGLNQVIMLKSLHKKQEKERKTMAINAYSEIQHFTIGSSQNIPLETIREHPIISSAVMGVFLRIAPPAADSNLDFSKEFVVISPRSDFMSIDGIIQCGKNELIRLQDNEKQKGVRLLKVACVAAILAASILMIVFTWGTPLVALGFILFLVHFLAAGPLLFNIDREIVFSKNSWLQFAQLMFSLCGGMPFLSLYHILAKTRLSEYENKGAAELKELKEQKQGIESSLNTFFEYYKEKIHTEHVQRALDKKFTEADTAVKAAEKLDLAKPPALQELWDKCQVLSEVRDVREMFYKLETFYVNTVGALQPLQATELAAVSSASQ